MTTATYLGQHHAEVRKKTFGPGVRGTQYARGRSPLPNLNNTVPSLRRLLRRRDKADNVASKKELTSQYFSEALSSLDQMEEPVEEIYQ